MDNNPVDRRFSQFSNSGKQKSVRFTEKLTNESNLSEQSTWFTIVVFITSAFAIHLLFNKTLITVLETSKIFAMIGLLGFLTSYFIRNAFQLSVLDGLFYSFFGVAPAGLALMLFVNSQCNQTFTESYPVVERETGGSGYTCILENKALDRYWHIRNLNRHETNIRGKRLYLTLCKGKLGFRVMQSRKLK